MGSKPYKPKKKAKQAKPARLTPGELNRRRKIQEVDDRMSKLEVSFQTLTDEIRQRLFSASPGDPEEE